MAQQSRLFSLKVLTINTHKGFTTFNRRFMLPELRDAVRTVSADIVSEGHHGNAVLSRFPIEHDENHDLSVGDSEKRGLLYCRIAPPALASPIHIASVHLGLRESHRRAQLMMMAKWVNSLPESEPVVVAGDFNDWRQRASPILQTEAGLEEIFTRTHGRPARTFPVAFPLLRLDRIYVKNAYASSPGSLALRNWRHLSDHAPLSAEIHL